jgi:hypothetical protein
MAESRRVEPETHANAKNNALDFGERPSYIGHAFQPGVALAPFAELP